MMIDIFTHIWTPKYAEELNKRAVDKFSPQYSRYIRAFPGLTSLDNRFKIMDKFEGLVQILTISLPNIESITEPKDTVELAQIANDEMAELIMKNPDRFVAAIACLPLNDVDAALKETDRTINNLRFRGVEIFTDINGKPIDLPEFWPLYEKMEFYDLPILLHPRRAKTQPDYAGETESKHLVFTSFGWPYETSVAMARLVFSGVFDKYPNLKVITHHAGGMIPYFCKRIQLQHNFHTMRLGYRYEHPLVKAPLDYYRMFYCDTAIHGNTAGLMCAHAFFGTDHMLFATDMPFDAHLGEWSIRETIRSVEEMTITYAEKKRIFEDNARELLHLPI